MKKLLIAALATVTLAGSAFAQGAPRGAHNPVYGSGAFRDTQYEPAFSKLFAGPSNDARDVSNKITPSTPAQATRS